MLGGSGREVKSSGLNRVLVSSPLGTGVPLLALLGLYLHLQNTEGELGKFKWIFSSAFLVTELCKHEEVSYVREMGLRWEIQGQNQGERLK